MEKPAASPADGSQVARMQRQLVRWTRSEVLQEAFQGSPLSVATPRAAPSTANRKPTFEPTNPSQSVARSRTPCQATRWTAAWTSQNATVRDDPTRPALRIRRLGIRVPPSAPAKVLVAACRSLGAPSGGSLIPIRIPIAVGMSSTYRDTTPVERRSKRGAGSLRERSPGVWEIRVVVGFDPGQWAKLSAIVHDPRRRRIRPTAKTRTCRLVGRHPRSHHICESAVDHGRPAGPI
jgi:hypothetical protein